MCGGARQAAFGNINELGLVEAVPLTGNEISAAFKEYGDVVNVTLRKKGGEFDEKSWCVLFTHILPCCLRTFRMCSRTFCRRRRCPCVVAAATFFGRRNVICWFVVCRALVTFGDVVSARRALKGQTVVIDAAFDEVRHQSHCRWCVAANVGGGGLVVVVVAETLCTWHAR